MARRLKETRIRSRESEQLLYSRSQSAATRICRVAKSFGPIEADNDETHICDVSDNYSWPIYPQFECFPIFERTRIVELAEDARSVGFLPTLDFENHVEVPEFLGECSLVELSEDTLDLLEFMPSIALIKGRQLMEILSKDVTFGTQGEFGSSYEAFESSVIRAWESGSDSIWNPEFVKMRTGRQLPVVYTRMRVNSYSKVSRLTSFVLEHGAIEHPSLSEECDVSTSLSSAKISMPVRESLDSFMDKWWSRS